MVQGGFAGAISTEYSPDIFRRGWEFRQSEMFSYDSKSFSFKLGTNNWKDLHAQKTGIFGIGSGDFALTYENDGSPFAKGIPPGLLADNNDSYRTAAMTIKIGDFQAGFNLFTGARNFKSYAEYFGEDFITMTMFNKANPLLLDGIRYYNGLVKETGPRYRMGGAYIGWKDYRFGIDSDQYVRRPIQNRLAHDMISPQPGFEVLSKGFKSYLQFQTKNNFTSW